MSHRAISNAYTSLRLGVYTKHTHINKVIADMYIRRLRVFTKIHVEILCIIHALNSRKKFRNIDVNNIGHNYLFTTDTVCKYKIATWTE